MNEGPVPVELGFAEFTAKLISEVFEAVVAAQFDQEKRLAELGSAAGHTVEEFADRFITDEQIASELAKRFPGDSPERPTSIYAGAPYQPAGKGVVEHPSVYDELQLRLVRGDYVKRRQRTTLTAQGVDKVSRAAQEQLAIVQRAAVQEIMRRGVPRVIADAGRVNSKLTYEVVTSEASAGKPEGELAASTFVGVALPQPDVLTQVRLKVRMADERAPHNQKLQVNVFGEVEISLKTVT